MPTKRESWERAVWGTYEGAMKWATANIDGFPGWRVEETAHHTFHVALIPNDLYVSEEDVS